MAIWFKRGDIVSVGQLLDADDSAAGAQRSVASLLGLVEADTMGSDQISVWCPFAMWVGSSQFSVPAEPNLVVAYLTVLNDLTIMVLTDREQDFTLPFLVGLDERRRLRMVFVYWFFEAGPGPGYDVEPDTMWLLCEL